MGVIHHDHAAVGLDDLIDDGGQGGDQIQVKFPLQPLLDDLHMEHAQKAAAEAEAQGHGALRLEGQGGVVELQLFQRVPQIGIFGAVLGIDAAVDHGPGRPVAGQGLGRGPGGIRDGVAHLGVRHVLDAGGEIAHVAGRQLLAGVKADGAQVSHLHHLVFGAGGHEQHLAVFADGAVHKAHEHDDAPVIVILAVKNQGL